VLEAVNLAYRWESLALTAAREGLAYPQPLSLEPVAALASENVRELAEVLTAAGEPVPEPTLMGWRDVLTELSREHEGVQALERAVSDEPGLGPLADRLRASSEVYREAALNALASIEPDS